MKKEVDVELNKLDNLLIEAKDTNGKWAIAKEEGAE